jgi:hypothetical protein
MRRELSLVVIGILFSAAPQAPPEQPASVSAFVVTERLCSIDSENGELSLTIRLKYLNPSGRVLSGFWSPKVADTRVARNSSDARQDVWVVQLPWEVHRARPQTRLKTSELRPGREKNADVELRVPVDLRSSGTVWTLRLGETYWFSVVFADDQLSGLDEPRGVEFEHSVPSALTGKCAAR